MIPDEIKEAIAAGEIGAITLDTSVFDGNGLRLEAGLLNRIQQFRGSSIQFVLSEIVAKEVVAHLTRGASEAQAQFDTACKGIEKFWLIPRTTLDSTFASLFQAKPAEKFAQERFDTFIETMGGRVISASEHVEMQELLRRYFVSEAPFSQKDGKKNEFPDAFALLSLEALAQKSGKKLLVVSKDGDWVRFCNNSDALIHIDDLGTALSLFHRDASVACNALALRLQNNAAPALVLAIENAVHSHLEQIQISVEAESDYCHDDEVTEYTVKKISLSRDEASPPKIEPIDAGDDYLVAKTLVTAEIQVECTFNFWVKDGVDKDYVPIGSASVRQNKTLYFDILLTLGDPMSDAVSIDEIEFVGKERLHIEFGYIRPEWNEDPNSEYY